MLEIVKEKVVAPGERDPMLTHQTPLPNETEHDGVVLKNPLIAVHATDVGSTLNSVINIADIEPAE
jgi:hypothetical protein